MALSWNITVQRDNGQYTPSDTNRKANSKPTFQQAKDDWLEYWQADRRLRHSDRTLCTRLYLDFNRRHYNETGQLVAWRGWESLMAKTVLGKTALSIAIKRLERFEAIDVDHGRYDHATKKRAGNQYHARLPRFAPVNLAGTKVHKQGSRPRFTTKVQTCEQDSLSRLSELDSLN